MIGRSPTRDARSTGSTKRPQLLCWTYCESTAPATIRPWALLSARRRCGVFLNPLVDGDLRINSEEFLNQLSPNVGLAPTSQARRCEAFPHPVTTGNACTKRSGLSRPRRLPSVMVFPTLRSRRRARCLTFQSHPAVTGPDTQLVANYPNDHRCQSTAYRTVPGHQSRVSMSIGISK